MEKKTVEKPVPPCIECKTRNAECHPHCEKYLDFFEQQCRYNDFVRRKRSNNL